MPVCRSTPNSTVTTRSRRFMASRPVTLPCWDSSSRTATQTTTASSARHTPSVPVYLGEATQRILREAAFFTRAGGELPAAGHLGDPLPLQLGPFTVTPYLMDHSAFDAYALLVEAGERRLLYSGDLRGHGRKATLFERLLREPSADVDTLLL